MITAIIIISIGFAWLLKETNFLRVNLMQSDNPSMLMLTSQDANLALPKSSYQPSEFVSCDLSNPVDSKTIVNVKAKIIE